MSLTSLGARGATLSQIQQTLRLSPGILTKKSGMSRVFSSMTADSIHNVVLDMTSLLWIPRGLAIKAEYAKSVQDIFQTRIRDADFTRPEEVRQVINQRIENITRGHFTDFFPRGSVTKQTRMLLANVFYFKGIWLHTFNRSDTYKETFFLADGQSIMAPTMHVSGTFQAGVLDNVGAKVIFLPYQGKRHGLLCILPDKKKKLTDVESYMLSSGYTPTTLLQRLIHRDVNVSLPKFKMQFGTEMSHVFKKMGIRNLFTHEADLSDVSSDSATLRISSVYHQCILEVNEGGSEASAATGLEVTPLMGGSGIPFGPMEFRVDRPFLIYLIDRENENIPLIMGRVSNPLKNFHTNLNPRRHFSEPLTINAEKNSLKEDHIPIQLSAGLGRLEFWPNFKPYMSREINRQDDQVFYPQKPSYINYYKSAKHFANPDFSHLSPVSNLHSVIIFPDHDFDERHRWKRDNINLTAFPDLVSVTSPSTPENGAPSTRLRDPLWFNKPTLPEVIIPINIPESNQRPTSSFYRPSNNMVPSPQSFAGALLPPATIKPEELTPLTDQTPSSAITPNLFFTPTIAPRPPPVITVNNGWNQNEQYLGGAHGFAPSDGDMTLFNNRPVFVSPTWFSAHTDPYSPYPSGTVPELQGILFPEYRLSSRD